MVGYLSERAPVRRSWGTWTLVAVLAAGAAACGSVSREAMGQRVVDGTFQRQSVSFRSGYAAEIAMALNGSELCVAVGHDASQDGTFGDELIEKWLRLRRLSVGGERLVGDLSFAPVYPKTDLEGEAANCVRVQPASASVIDERIEVSGPSRVRGAF